VNRALQRYLEAASGLTNLTASKAEKIVKGLVRTGEEAGDQVGDMVEDLMERQRRNREAVTALVKSETTRAVRAMGLATGKQVERLQKQVVDLKRELRRVERDTGTESAARKTEDGGAPAKKATAKKASAKKATAKKATAKKATAKKASAKKASAKKASAKKATSAGGPAEQPADEVSSPAPTDAPAPSTEAPAPSSDAPAPSTDEPRIVSTDDGPPAETSPVLAEEVRDLTEGS
jgi:polyhydroxyalkanoate synthesis regulator phasin